MDDRMEWRNAAKRSRIGIVDGSVLGPIVLCIVVFSFNTIMLLLIYASMSAYMTHRGMPPTYLLRRIRFYFRGGVVVARPQSYWRKLLG